MKKKVFSIMVALSLSVLLTACDENTSSKTNNTTTTTTKSTTIKQESTDSEEYHIDNVSDARDVAEKLLYKELLSFSSIDVNSSSIVIGDFDYIQKYKCKAPVMSEYKFECSGHFYTKSSLGKYGDTVRGERINFNATIFVNEYQDKGDLWEFGRCSVSNADNFRIIT